jgi:hypothetical protein
MVFNKQNLHWNMSLVTVPQPVSLEVVTEVTKLLVLISWVSFGTDHRTS